MKERKKKIDDKSPQNKKLYYLTVSCWAPMNGIIPIEAESPEQAEKIVREQLTTAKDITVHEIKEELDVVDEIDTPPTIN